MAGKLPTTEILARLSGNSRKNKNEVFTRLYRYLLRPDLYYTAYKNLYANNGASTRGVNDDTADGFSETKINGIIRSLSDGTYQPNPVRRTYIAKANGKLRPLGIPTFTDKLVQEVLRMVLESVYEPLFLNCSHGFRPRRSCHTALESLKREFTGARWFVEGDIQGCFDNIDHQTLVGLLNVKIKDARIAQLIYKFLKAGYMEDWRYNNTYSGAPQGGIISPLLANIYLHELDKFVMILKSGFDKPRDRTYTPEYQALCNEMSRIRYHIKRAQGTWRDMLISQYQEIRKELLKTPSKSQTDKKLVYMRYADDFLIGICGNREDCQWVKSQLGEFIAGTLKMQLSEEKTLITHSSERARFLGYDIRVRREQNIKRSKRNGYTSRSLSNKVDISVPLVDKIRKFIIAKGIAEQKPDGTLFAIRRPALQQMTDLEIVSTYNAELRGICNYYALASNFCRLSHFAYLMEYSCLKTLAGKHNSSMSKIRRMFKDGTGRWGIAYETKQGRKRCYFARFMECKGTKSVRDTMDNSKIVFGCSINSFESRLKAKCCELCGTTESKHYEIHHIHKLKDLKGKNAWERAMIAKRRKTIVLCRSCHHQIHNN